MKLVTAFLSLILLAFAAPVIAQDEAASPAAAEETPSAGLDLAPSPSPTEAPFATPAAVSTPSVSTAPEPAKPEATKPEAKKSASPAAAEAAATPSGKKMSVEATLKDMENKWVAAFLKHDASVVEPMLAQDFIGVNAKGKVQNRRATLAEIKDSKETYTTEKNDVIAVRRYGNNVAVVVGTGREKGNSKDGKKFDRTYRYTDTWVDRGGKWQCVASQVSLVSQK